jgi:hypothetical protein
VGLPRGTVTWIVVCHVGFIPALKREAFASKFP